MISICVSVIGGVATPIQSVSMCRIGQTQAHFVVRSSRFNEIALVLVCCNHVASVIVNADHGMMCAATVLGVSDGECNNRDSEGLGSLMGFGHG